MNTVDHRLFGQAIDDCDTASFEKFVQAFHAAIVGTDFVPLGGTHDGGADGYEEAIFESKGRSSVFLQASKTPDIEGKIKKTIRRLKEYGREPHSVIFYFSSPIATVDAIQERLSNSENITISIRAKGYLEAQINNSPQTVQAYNSYLKGFSLQYADVGVVPGPTHFPFESRTLCAFVGQEVERRRGNATLLVSLTDALILWSLEGTDPDKKVFLTDEDIYQRIISAVPTSKQFIKSILKERLDKLSSKSNPSGREISWHKKEGKYALRFDERQKLVEDNAYEVNVFNQFMDEVKVSVRSYLDSGMADLVDKAASAALSCVEALFRKQGLFLGLFMHEGVNDDDAGDGGVTVDEIGVIDISDDIAKAVSVLGLPRPKELIVQEVLRKVLRKLVYSPNEQEKEYLRRLSSTYFIMFALKNEPRIVEYFNSLSQNLILYVGSDLVIKMLSEYHLPPESQMITRTMDLLNSNGATLILGEPALEEVHSHLHASILEFEYNYSQVEHIIDEDFVPLIDRILIRAYFYARLGINTTSRRPRGWRSYIGQFCTYGDVKQKKGREALRMYLSDKYHMKFESLREMRRGIDLSEFRTLKENLLLQRTRLNKNGKENQLAINDALHVLRVFQKRIEINENSAPNPFGYRTWWLTHEKAIRKAAVVTFGGNKPRFIMRPEFLLNYIGLMPTKAEVNVSYKTIFPTILGVSLGRRADSSLVHDVLRAAREALDVDPSRARAILNEKADRLKSDQIRIYETNVETC